MVEYDIFLTLTIPTFNKIISQSNGDNALILYLFYYKTSRIQGTNQAKATTNFCMKGLGWGKEKVQQAKKVLVDLNLIESIRPKRPRKDGHYVRLKYITSRETAENITDYAETGFSTDRKTRHQMLKECNNKCLKDGKSFSDEKDPSLGKDDHTSDKSVFKVNLDSSEKIEPIIKIKKPDPVMNSQYTWTISDRRNYNEFVQAGATKHREGTRAEIYTLDMIHALFSPKCKDPYHKGHIPAQYVNKQWDMDEILEVFHYQLEHAKKYDMKPIRNMGNFIWSPNYRGQHNEAWSPLLRWDQRMKKTTAHELTEEGSKLFQSLKRAQIEGAKELDSSTINRVGKALFEKTSKYIFLDSSLSATCPFGIVDYFTKRYIKHKLNNRNFKLVYIGAKKFIDEFIADAKKANAIKTRNRRPDINQTQRRAATHP